MNFKLIIIGGLVFASGYFLAANTTGLSENNSAEAVDAATLAKKLNQANAQNAQLKDKIAVMTNKGKAKNEVASNNRDSSDNLAGNESNVESESYHNTAPEQPEITLASAYQSLENGDMDEATKQFNALLGEATDANKRNEIIDGLIAIHEASYQWIMQDGNYIHGAMWQLFEMQKLRPEGQTVNRAKALSKDILNRANEYLEADNLLSGADYLNSLVHTTNMMGYDVEDMPREAMVAKVKEIEQQPAYKESLYQRATNNLMNGSDLEKNIVFWDFAKLAEIDAANRSTDTAFNAQFADATLVHLTHLKEMNKPGEVKSRQDYIRYAFPHLMKDERISSFF